VLTYIGGDVSLLASANVSGRFMGCGQLERLVLYAASFVIMMSQNRQAAKDRLMAESDYHCNVKGEEETRHIMEHLDHQDVVLFQLVKRIEEQHKEIKEHLVRLDPELARRLGMDIQEVSKELVEEETGDSNIAGNS
jgi:uncharacterized membrane protein